MRIWTPVIQAVSFRSSAVDSPPDMRVDAVALRAQMLLVRSPKLVVIIGFGKPSDEPHGRQRPCYTESEPDADAKGDVVEHGTDDRA